MSSTNEGAQTAVSPVASVRSIATAVPPVELDQPVVRDLFAGQPGLSPLARRLIGSVFNSSAIERRYTPIDELAGERGEPSEPGEPGEPREPGVPNPAPAPPPTFYDTSSGTVLAPSTGVRNAVYARAIRPLLREAAERALAAAPDLNRTDITHVVTVSCTGFFAPGPDYTLVRDLGLAPSTRRLHIGFMGCYGAFPALRAARSTCLAEPGAVVLIVCAELCSLHLRSSDDPDTIVASSVFGDGAAAAIVTARPAPAGAAVLEIDALETVLTDDGEADMAWTIGDLGFEMVLSSYVPRILEARIAEALRPLLEADGDGREAPDWSRIDQWAVHPGGRAILDRVQRALGLSDEQLAPSRSVLRDYGNMSSATVLFILERLLRGDTADTDATAATRQAQGPERAGRPEPVEGPIIAPSPERIAAMAFGPGLTVESALFTKRVGR